MLHRGWFPSRSRASGSSSAVPAIWLPALVLDPEVARLTRYQEGPMSAVEIERFFQARVLGTDSLALAIHLRGSDRLIGTCAFSQLDGDNGSTLFHITIGEKDAWGQGYGTEATELMLEHAFERLRLHRVTLSVFAFNERAIRSYRNGLHPRGRARVRSGAMGATGTSSDEPARGRLGGDPRERGTWAWRWPARPSRDGRRPATADGAVAAGAAADPARSR